MIEEKAITSVEEILSPSIAELKLLLNELCKDCYEHHVKYKDKIHFGHRSGF